MHRSTVNFFLVVLGWCLLGLLDWFWCDFRSLSWSRCISCLHSLGSRFDHRLERSLLFRIGLFLGLFFLHLDSEMLSDINILLAGCANDFAHHFVWFKETCGIFRLNILADRVNLLMTRGLWYFFKWIGNFSKLTNRWFLLLLPTLFCCFFLVFGLRDLPAFRWWCRGILYVIGSLLRPPVHALWSRQLHIFHSSFHIGLIFIFRLFSTMCVVIFIFFCVCYIIIFRWNYDRPVATFHHLLFYIIFLLRLF